MSSNCNDESRDVAGEAILHPVAALRLQRMLEETDQIFGEWMEETVAAVAAARQDFLDAGGPEVEIEKLRRVVEEAARDAHSCGRPAAARVAQMLHRLLASVPAAAAAGDIVDHHIEAMAIAARAVRRSGDGMDELLDHLAEATDEYISARAPEAQAARK